MVTTIVREQLGILASHPTPDTAMTGPVDRAVGHRRGAGVVTGLVVGKVDAILAEVKLSVWV